MDYEELQEEQLSGFVPNQIIDEYGNVWFYDEDLDEYCYFDEYEEQWYYQSAEEEEVDLEYAGEEEEILIVEEED